MAPDTAAITSVVIVQSCRSMPRPAEGPGGGQPIKPLSSHPSHAMQHDMSLVMVRPVIGWVQHPRLLIHPIMRCIASSSLPCTRPLKGYLMRCQRRKCDPWVGHELSFNRSIVQSILNAQQPRAACRSLREKVVAASVRLELGLPSSLTSRSPLLKQTTSMRLRTRLRSDVWTVKSLSILQYDDQRRCFV